MTNIRHYLFALSLIGFAPTLPSTFHAAAEEPAPTPAAPAFPKLPETRLPEFKLDPAFELSGRIAFSAKVGKYERIFVLDLNAKSVRTLIDGPGNNFYPSWSPDGTQLTFVSDRDGNDEIYVADWEGANVTRLTTNTAPDGNPSFSPDGKKIVFFSEAGQKPDNANLFTISVTGGEPTRLTSFSGRNTTPRWSADGTRILFSTDRSWPGWDLCVWNIRGRSESCILSGRQSYCRGEWSHSGKHLAYSFGSFKQVDIGILDVETQQTSTVSSMENREYDVAWSPDDTYLLFTGESDTPEVFQLFITDSKKEKVNPLIKAPYSIRFPTWSGIKTRDLELKKMRAEQGQLAHPKPQRQPRDVTQ